VAIGFVVAAAVMAIGGIAELVFGVRAERLPLEDIARPLTVEEAENPATSVPSRRVESSRQRDS
jgi:hypothetical protein